ncbi:hypothetical protein ACI2JA_03640 [Alkalihalobacillus sp. NPDC078783]
MSKPIVNYVVYAVTSEYPYEREELWMWGGEEEPKLEEHVDIQYSIARNMGRNFTFLYLTVEKQISFDEDLELPDDHVF